MDALRYLALELTDQGITVHRDLHGSFVARADVVHIEVRHGIARKRASLQLSVGVVLIATGLLFASALAGWLDATFPQGASILTGACVPIVLLGIYTVWFATRRVLYLHVRERRGAKQIVVDDADMASLALLLGAASQRFGYAIRWTIPEPAESITPYRSPVARLPQGPRARAR